MRRTFGALQRALATPARHPRTAVVLGRLLGVAFLVCFGTGLYSHLLQNPLPGMTFPTRPVQLYRVTQGLHIATGIAAIPLLLGKLWTVFPLLFAWPPVTGLRSLLERASIAVFVASSLLQLGIGLVNTYQWYPWPFSFRQVHFALSFVIVASLALHIAVKLPVIQRWWRRRDSVDAEGALLQVEAGEGDLARPASAPRPRGVTGKVLTWLESAPAPSERVSRRTAIGAVGLGAVAAVGLTAGQSAPVLAPLNVLAPRKAGFGAQGLPVNKTAQRAGVVDAARSPDWTLSVTGPGGTRTLSRADLEAMPQTRARLPISCVEGWSTEAEWTGVRFADLAASVGATGRDFTVRSIGQGAYSITLLQAVFVDDPLTLIALTVNGADLDLDHGFPARLIAPARPGVLQTKWLGSLEAR